MTIELLLKGDPYILTPRPEITNENLFPSGVIQDQIASSDKFWMWGFLKDILKKEKKPKIRELFFDVSGLKTHDFWNGTFAYIVAPTTVAIAPSLDDSIVLRNQSEILAFLECHPELKEYLSNAKTIIRKHFTEVSLEAELLEDFEPGVTDRKKILFLYIITDAQPKEALEKLEEIDKEVFDNLQVNSQFFNINLEFKP